MKITRKQLRRIIKEELGRVLEADQEKLKKDIVDIENKLATMDDAETSVADAKAIDTTLTDLKDRLGIS